MIDKQFDKETFKKSVKDNVKFLYRRKLEEATQEQLFQAVSYTVKDVKVKSDAENTDHCRNSPDKIIDSCINGFDNLQHKIPLLSFLSDKVCFDLILRLWSGNSSRFPCFDTFQKPCHIASQSAHDL